MTSANRRRRRSSSQVHWLRISLHSLCTARRADLVRLIRRIAGEFHGPRTVVEVLCAEVWCELFEQSVEQDIVFTFLEKDS